MINNNPNGFFYKVHSYLSFDECRNSERVCKKWSELLKNREPFLFNLSMKDCELFSRDVCHLNQADLLIFSEIHGNGEIKLKIGRIVEEWLKQGYEVNIVLESISHKEKIDLKTHMTALQLFIDGMVFSTKNFDLNKYIENQQLKARGWDFKTITVEDAHYRDMLVSALEKTPLVTLNFCKLSQKLFADKFINFRDRTDSMCETLKNIHKELSISNKKKFLLRAGTAHIFSYVSRLDLKNFKYEQNECLFQIFLKDPIKTKEQQIELMNNYTIEKNRFEKKIMNLESATCLKKLYSTINEIKNLVIVLPLKAKEHMLESSIYTLHEDK